MSHLNNLNPLDHSGASRSVGKDNHRLHTVLRQAVPEIPDNVMWNISQRILAVAYNQQQRPGVQQTTTTPAYQRAAEAEECNHGNNRGHL